jgi:Tfp pilus assembly protein PilW
MSRPLSRRRCIQGLSLTEVLVAGFVLALVFTGVATFVNGVGSAMSRQETTNELSNYSRLAMDEMLLHLRGAKSVLPARSVNGTDFHTDTNDIVFLAPGYDPAATQVVLPNVDDTVAFQFDAGDGTIKETIVPGTGSTRAVRQAKVIARNVRDVAYTFSVREEFTAAATGSQTFTLRAAPQAAPMVLIDGVGVQSGYDAESRAVTVEVPVRGAKVQAVYNIPTADTASYPLVTQVDIAVTFAGKDSRQRAYTFVMPGSARLRNHRP